MTQNPNLAEEYQLLRTWRDEVPSLELLARINQAKEKAVRGQEFQLAAELRDVEKELQKILKNSPEGVKEVRELIVEGVVQNDALIVRLERIVAYVRHEYPGSAEEGLDELIDEVKRAKVPSALWDRAVETLGSNYKANQWLRTGVQALGGRTPLQVLNETNGAEWLSQILGRIDHGVTS